MLKSLTALSIVFVLLAPVSHAADKQDCVDKKQAVIIAKESEKGKVLKITEKKEEYVVRILKPKGRVVDVLVAKSTGKVKKENN